MRILAVSGSLRRDSHNTQLLRAAIEAAPEGVEVEVWEGLGEVPLYDQDLDTTEPIELEPDVFFETPVTETEAGDELAGPPSGVVPGHFEAELTPSSGSYAALVTDVHPSLNMAIPTGTFDDGASQSGSYAAIVADVPVSRVTTICDLPTPEEPPVSYPR